MSGYVVTYAGRFVSWQLRLQKPVTLSTTEAKYMAVVEANKKVIWMKDFIGELGIRQEELWLYCDGQSVIHLAKNTVYHSKTKHIQRRDQWIRERVEDKDFALTKIPTEENWSNMLTKVRRSWMCPEDG